MISNRSCTNGDVSTGEHFKAPSVQPTSTLSAISNSSSITRTMLKLNMRFLGSFSPSTISQYPLMNSLPSRLSAGRERDMRLSRRV